MVLQVCGGEYTSPQGIIASPYHPDPYPSGRTCRYLISQPLNTAIRVEFLNFDIEGSFNCNFDYLEIRDGNDQNSSLVGRFCGDPSLTPDPIMSSLNYLWISFVTDGSVQNRGFRLNYTAVPVACGGILTAPSGSIRSPVGDGGTYPHGVTCRWIIRGDPGRIVRLTFETFALEGSGASSACRFDYVEVLDGNVLRADGSEISIGR